MNFEIRNVASSICLGSGLALIGVMGAVLALDQTGLVDLSSQMQEQHQIEFGVGVVAAIVGYIIRPRI